MKTHRRARKQKFNRSSQTYSLSQAKTYLGRLAEKAVQGEPVYIIRGHDRLILQHLPPVDPIPLRPPGYFANCYTKEDIELDNLLSKASVVRAPADLG